jgi:very-short-patch-repair endonuclease
MNDSDELFDSLIALSDRNKQLESIFKIVIQDNPRRWDAIRRIYKLIDTQKYEPYPVDWTMIFTPIESYAWGEIRYYGLPFWPQYPIDRYFSDFADPNKKIIIECDGAAYHSREKDAVRDSFLSSNGWAIYRISGADCHRSVDSPWEEIIHREIDRNSEEAKKMIRLWMSSTVEGLICAIDQIHYREPSNPLLREMALDVLASRSSYGLR